MRRPVAIGSNLIAQKHLHTTEQPQLVPMDSLKPLVKLMVAQGVQPQALFAQTQIETQTFVDQSRSIRTDDFLQIILNSRKLSASDDYALKLGEQFFIHYDGALAQRIMCCDHAHQAMEVLVQYQPLFTQVLALDFNVVDDVGFFSLQPRVSLGATLDHFVEYAFSALYWLGRFCTGQNTLDIRFEFTQSEHPKREKFEAFFGNTVTFGCKHNRAILSAKTLSLPCVFRHQQFAQKHEQVCLKYLAHIQQESDLLKQVKLTLRHQPLDTLSLEGVAQQLHMSPRSLRRHLQQQASSFSELLEEERKRKARTQLIESNLSLDRVSEQLGYHSAASFSRAFKRWFGISPAQFRQQHSIKSAKRAAPVIQD